MLSAPDVAPGCVKDTRAASIVFRGRIAPVQQATRVTTRKRKQNESAKSSKSPRTMYTYDATDSSTLERSACSSSHTSFDVNSGTLGPPESTPSNLPECLPEGIPSFGPFEESSLFSRPSSPSKLETSRTFEDSVKGSVLELANEFTDSSTLLQGLRDSKIAPGKTTMLIIEAVTSRAKSAKSAETITKHVTGRIHFYLDTRNASAVALTWEGSLFLVRDFLESLKERGRTAPSYAKHALTVWPDALGIDWPLTNPLVLSAATVEFDEGPRHAPAWASTGR